MEAIQNNNLNSKGTIHFGHLGLILTVAVLLVGVTWMKNPGIFSGNKIHSADAEASDLPRYVAYEPPAELTQPMVAGASTESSGPMVINEDGSLSPVLNIGQVLGATTDDMDISKINATVISDSQDTIKNYVQAALQIEDNYINSLSLETAFSSNDPELLLAESSKLKRIMEGLSNLPVPVSLENLHKYKILQYQSAINILNKFPSVDSDPESVAKSLGVFLQSQERLEAELESLKVKFPDLES